MFTSREEKEIVEGMAMTECCYILRITYANTTFGDTSSTVPFSVLILYLGEPTIAMVS